MTSATAPSASPTLEEAPRFPWLAFLGCSALLLAICATFFSVRVDDAYIVLRYASNLVNGAGLTFNPGERVEGFTCPALVGIEAALVAAHLDVLLWVKVLGVVSVLFVLWLTMRLALELTSSRTTTLVAGLIVAAQPMLATASATGLETAPFVACLMGALLLSLRPGSVRSSAAMGLLLALAILFRPDGALASGLILITKAWRDRKRASNLRELITAGLVLAAIVLPIYLWKASYFGAWVPNTALAKVPAHGTGRFQSGWLYLWELSTLHIEAIGALALLFLAVKRKAAFLSLAVFVGVWAAYVVSTGGDWIPHGRFVLPAIPALAIALATLTTQSAPPRARLALTAVLLPAVLVGAVLDWQKVQRTTDGLTARANEGLIPLGQYLHRAAHPGASIATLDIGMVGHLSGLRVIDTGGLVDRQIATLMHHGGGVYQGHLFFPDEASSRQIADIVFKDAPEFIAVVMSDELPSLLARRAPLASAYPQDRALVADPRLRTGYEYLCSAPYDLTRSDMRPVYNVFIRKDVKPLAAPTIRDGHAACRLAEQ